MNLHALADLQKTLTPHVPLGKSRLETLCILLLGMIGARTVNLTHIATERPSRALIASTYRRLQRFFQHVTLPEDWTVGLVTALIGNPGSWYLCLTGPIGRSARPTSTCSCWRWSRCGSGCR